MPTWTRWTRCSASCGQQAGPPPEDPDSGEDAELGGRDSIADRLSDEVSWLRQCAGWLAHLDADGCHPAVNLRPAADWPERAVVAVNLARVAAVIDRIAADVDELARGEAAQCEVADARAVFHVTGQAMVDQVRYQQP